MGRYIDWKDVEAVYPQLGRGPGADQVNSFHLLYAEAELDGLLGTTYSVPFSSNNLTARELSVALTMMRVGALKDKNGEALRKQTYERIDRIREGKEFMVTLVGSTPTIMYPTGAAWSSTENYTPTFGVGNIEDMVVSSSQQYDEEVDRG